MHVNFISFDQLMCCRVCRFLYILQQANLWPHIKETHSITDFESNLLYLFPEHQRLINVISIINKTELQFQSQRLGLSCYHLQNWGEILQLASYEIEDNQAGWSCRKFVKFVAPNPFKLWPDIISIVTTSLFCRQSLFNCT